LARESVSKKPLRVALIASERTARDYSEFLRLLLVGLADESVPALLICPRDCDPDSIFTGAAEVVDPPLLGLPFTERIAARLLAQQVGKFEPTVLHCLCESKASLTRRLAHRLHLPYVLMVNSMQGRWAQLSISSKRCRKIIVPAKTIADNVTGAHPRFAGRIEQINVGTFVAESSGCFSQPNRIATMVTAHPQDHAEDFENLFGALRHLKLDGHEFMAVVAGDGRAAGHLWQLMTAMDLLTTVTMVSRLRPWRSVLAAGDIFIHPQPRGVFDMSLLGAMSGGAAVAGCKGRVDDLIIEDETAVVFDPKDDLSIMRSLKRLLDRREFARQIATNARQHLVESYAAGDMIGATIGAYRNAQG
jgi:glycosyltransferase involved in cell wall biosynthesis